MVPACPAPFASPDVVVWMILAAATRLPSPRRIVVPLFGAYLTQLRGAQSRGQIVARLQTLGLPLDRSTLLQYERGTVGAPDAVVLWGLSQVYQVPLADLIGVLAQERTQARVRPPDPAPLTGAQRQTVAELSGLDVDTQRAVQIVIHQLFTSGARRP